MILILTGTCLEVQMIYNIAHERPHTGEAIAGFASCGSLYMAFDLR